MEQKGTKKKGKIELFIQFTPQLLDTTHVDSRGFIWVLHFYSVLLVLVVSLIFLWGISPAKYFIVITQMTLHLPQTLF